MSTIIGRRALLLGLGGLAGCSGDARVTSPEQTATASQTATADDLDLREANVVGVETEAVDGGVRFSATLLHDDDGEDGYADWWQVERLDGEQLGRRELAHPHGTQAFTRSTTVAVPDGVDCVVVRGHDQTHGYGGRTVLVALDGGETVAHRQGADRTAFDADDCP